jgi:hypothetical protein
MFMLRCLSNGAGGIENGVTLVAPASAARLRSLRKGSLAEDGHGVGLLDVLLDLDSCFVVSILFGRTHILVL